MDEPSTGSAAAASLELGQVGRALGACAVYFTVVMLAMGLLRVPPLSDGVVPNVEGGVLAMLFGVAALLVYAAYFPPPVRWLQRGVLGRAAATYAVFLLVWVPLAMIVYPWVLRHLDAPLAAQPTLRYLAEPSLVRSTPRSITVIAMACLIVPLAEEILFRGYVQEMLKRFMPTTTAVVVAAVLFGLAHDVEYAVPIGFLGLLFGVLKERCGCLAVSVFAHALHNTITVVLVICFPQILVWLYGS